ncbi:hypothetical protein JMJ77_0013980 [Colletotrichum scovillei]|uniref:Uncharacterized protein n=1 Tax=Colletotrichum scovillei TaxID=1209932 RepID=A0A9P7UDY8_9PEZI|nr:hypothetical protein JMJ77_0013980 [Colletotrichum scovillei]KAG7065503.1 hypothetical protein JMJ78_0012256 [Colletotrichum scovillei]KAG7068103.1 hypothetical protein JMJ76_0007799 [Colletotrichum scovillei]
MYSVRERSADASSDHLSGTCGLYG